MAEKNCNRFLDYWIKLVSYRRSFFLCIFPPFIKPKHERHTDKGSPPTIVYLSLGSSFLSVLLSSFGQYVKGFQRSHVGEDVRLVTPYSFYHEDFVM